jgi:hypothetical protein
VGIQKYVAGFRRGLAKPWQSFADLASCCFENGFLPSRQARQSDLLPAVRIVFGFYSTNLSRS